MALIPAPTGGEEPPHDVELDDLCAENAAVLFETWKVDPPMPSRDGKSEYVGVHVILTVLTGKRAGTIDKTHWISKAGIANKLSRTVGDHVFGRLEHYKNAFGKQMGLTGPQDGDLELAQAEIDKQRRTPVAAGAPAGGGGAAAYPPDPPF
jgi:hypothetical protein